MRKALGQCRQDGPVAGRTGGQDEVRSVRQAARAILSCEAERCARVRPTFFDALGTIFALSPTLAVFGGNISAKFPAEVTKWAKSYNLSGSPNLTGRRV
jgi:hypothetical protein